MESLSNLAQVLFHKGEYDRVERLLREALAIHRKSLPEAHPLVASNLSNLGGVLLAKGNHDEAERLLRKALAIERKSLPEAHPNVALSLHNLAVALRHKGKHDEAERLYREALAIQRRSLPKGHPDVARTVDALFELLLARRTGRPPRRSVGNSSGARARSHGSLAIVGMCLLRQAKWAEAEPLLRECLAIREQEIPDDWSRYNAMSMLGEALCGEGNFTEAEPLLVEGYEKMVPPAQAAGS